MILSGFSILRQFDAILQGTTRPHVFLVSTPARAKLAVKVSVVLLVELWYQEKTRDLLLKSLAEPRDVPQVPERQIDRSVGPQGCSAKGNHAIFD